MNLRIQPVRTLWQRKSSVALWLLIILHGFAPAVQAQDGVAGIPGAYLHMGVGVRASGLGQAYTAMANDATAVYWNPAGLATQNPFRVYFMHSALFMDTSLDFFAATAPTSKFGSFGLGILSMSSKGFDQRSALNEQLGSFGASDLAFFLSWSEEAMPGLSIGLNYKVVNQSIMNYSGTGHGVDLGLKATFLKDWQAGLVLTNILRPKMTLAQNTETYPTQVRLGVSRKLFADKLSVNADFSKIFGWGSAQANFGLEYQAMENMAIRVGVDRGRFTFGSGLSFNRTGVDYSNSNVSELGSSHRYAFNYAFGGFRVDAKSDPGIFSPAGELNVSKIKLKVKSRSDVLNWRFEIVDLTGQTVREYSADGGAPDEIAWDGRDDRGNLAQDGKFDYRFYVITEDGKRMYAQGALVTIDTKGPDGFIGELRE